MTRLRAAAAGAQASGGPGGACGPDAWGDGMAGFGPDPPGPPDASVNKGQHPGGGPSGIVSGRPDSPRGPWQGGR
jgi:hypothetical protein